MAGKACVSLAEQLREKGNPQLAYALLRKQYEQGAWRDEPALWQVHILMQLAQLSCEIGQKGKCSVPYIDEALVLVQSLENDEVSGTYKVQLEGLRREYIGIK